MVPSRSGMSFLAMALFCSTLVGGVGADPLLTTAAAVASEEGDPLSPGAIRRAREAKGTAVRASNPPAVDPRMAAPDLLSDSKVIYRTRAFEEEPWRSEVLASRPALDWIKDPVKGTALRVTWKEGEEHALNWTYPFWPEAVEAVLQYDILFEGDWQPADGGKLIGWSSATKPDDPLVRLWPKLPRGTEGTLLAGNGGARVHGDDGWSLRGSFRTPIPAWQPDGGGTWLGTYAYHAGMAGYYGDAWWWDHYGQGPLTPGKWHTIRQRLRVNTPGERDGVLEVWVDGFLAFRKTDVYLRGAGPYKLTQGPYGVDTSLAIRRVWLNLYHGGTAKIPKDMHIRLANFAVARIE